jgi:hypothetical protein
MMGSAGDSARWPKKPKDRKNLMNTNDWQIIKDDARFLVVGGHDVDFELDSYEEAASFLDFMNEDETRKEDPDFFFDEWCYLHFELRAPSFDENETNDEQNEGSSEIDFEAELGEVLSYLGVSTV